MARAVHLHQPVRHGSIARLHRARSTFGTVTALGALLFVLATLGSLVFRVTDRLQTALAAWAGRRRAREEDRKLWELALSDPRLMSELVALQQHAPRPGSAWF